MATTDTCPCAAEQPPVAAPQRTVHTCEYFKKHILDELKLFAKQRADVEKQYKDLVTEQPTLLLRLGVIECALPALPQELEDIEWHTSLLTCVVNSCEQPRKMRRTLHSEPIGCVAAPAPPPHVTLVAPAVSWTRPTILSTSSKAATIVRPSPTRVPAPPLPPGPPSHPSGDGPA